MKNSENFREINNILNQKAFHHHHKEKELTELLVRTSFSFAPLLILSLADSVFSFFLWTTLIIFLFVLFNVFQIDSYPETEEEFLFCVMKDYGNIETKRVSDNNYIFKENEKTFFLTENKENLFSLGEYNYEREYVKSVN